MKRFFLSHLGTILVVAILAMVALAAIHDPERTRKVFQSAWSNVASSGTAGANAAEAGGTAEAAPSLLNAVRWNTLLSNNSPAEWFVVLAAVFLGFLAGKIASAIVGRTGRVLEQRGQAARAHVMTSLAGPLSLGFFAFGLSVGGAVLTMDPSLAKLLQQILKLLYTVAVVWYVYNLVDLLDIAFERLRGRIESRLDAQLVPLLRKSLRVVLVLIAALYVGKNIFDQDVSAWLTGLGIAGLAVSLAAQDSLKSLFGSFVILLDRPFKVGERIIYSGYDGVIEDIGFRSTKLRTGTGHLVTIPNANIAGNSVENIGRRPYIQRTLNLSIAYETPHEKVTEAISLVRQILAEEGIRERIHPTLVGAYEPRVFFSDYKPDSLNLQVSYWYTPPAYWDYMAHAERLNLRIFEEFEKTGVVLASPARAIHLAADPRRKPPEA